MKPPPPLERDVQKAVIALLELAHCKVYRLAQGYRREPGGTRQSKGLPDLYVVPTGRVVSVPDMDRANSVSAFANPFWVEVKRPGGRLRPEQAEFQGLVGLAGVRVVTGGVAEVKDYLVRVGLLRVPSP